MEKKYWLDSRKNVILLVRLFAGLCLAVLVIDAGFHRYAGFHWEGWFGFRGFFGFAAGVVLVLAARGMRRLLMRREGYYDE